MGSNCCYVVVDSDDPPDTHDVGAFALSGYYLIVVVVAAAALAFAVVRALSFVVVVQILRESQTME